MKATTSAKSNTKDIQCHGLGCKSDYNSLLVFFFFFACVTFVTSYHLSIPLKILITYFTISWMLSTMVENLNVYVCVCTDCVCILPFEVSTLVLVWLWHFLTLLLSTALVYSASFLCFPLHVSLNDIINVGFCVVCTKQYKLVCFCLFVFFFLYLQLTNLTHICALANTQIQTHKTCCWQPDDKSLCKTFRCGKIFATFKHQPMKSIDKKKKHFPFFFLCSQMFLWLKITIYQKGQINITKSRGNFQWMPFAL